MNCVVVGCVCVCVFSGRVGPTGEQKTSRQDRFFESFSANSGPGEGVPENHYKYEKIKKVQMQTAKVRTIVFFLLCGAIFSKKWRAQRLGVYRGFMQKSNKITI